MSQENTQTENEERIAELRKEIDSLDAQIIACLVKRAQCAHDVGVAKGGAAVYRPERERLILERMVKFARDCGSLLTDKAVAELYQDIVAACRAVEGRPKVAYLGPQGTFTEMAVISQFGRNIDLMPMATIDATIKAAESGVAGFAVVPVENSTQGSVTLTLDLLFTTSLTVIGEVNVPIAHNLMSRTGKLTDVRRVMAHPQALAQCRNWLSTHLPDVEQLSCTSNAQAAVEASKTEGVAAIAAMRAAEIYGLNIAAHAIQDDPRNTTRFLVLSKSPVGHEKTVENKTSLVFSVPNRAGCLLKALEPLSKHGVSMMRLESRPARNGAWDYNFYVDVQGHQEDAAVAAALKDMSEIASFFKVLGSYPVAAAWAG
mgnify:CR=1 FL=1